jgi:transcriptional regulator with XRE-family HTH domain
VYVHRANRHSPRTLDLPEFRRRFARRVRYLREAHGLRQEDLENYGLSWKSVQKLEYAGTDPKVSTLLKLSKAFRTTLPELLDLHHRPAKKK